MISGKPILQLWYFDETENNLENLFSKQREMKIINSLLSKCIVEKEKNCINNATELLNELDSCIFKLENKVEYLSKAIKRKCKVCCAGEYSLQVDGAHFPSVENFGLSPRGGRTFRVFVCDYCGHTQIFNYYSEDLPKGLEN
jgi:hypothetical protein